MKKRQTIFVVLVLAAFGAQLASASGAPDPLIGRISDQVSSFLDQFSEVKCTEQVTQEKLGNDGKTELNEQSTYDYLVILTNSGGELSLDESRLAIRQPKPDKKNTSLLVSNGFATLFLIFHPYYANSFEFTNQGSEIIDGHSLTKIGFQHIRGTRSPAALSLRGREYPLELSGTAWVDPQTGTIEKMVTDVGASLEDVGVKTLRSEMDYAPVPFRGEKQVYWFPLEARVEVETTRQHWRNTHHFSDYKKFSVNTEEQVAKQ